MNHFVRPIRSEGDSQEPPRGLLRRMSWWLRQDGPRPRPGWYESGGIIDDDAGLAVLDSTGHRHPLPDNVAKFVRRDSPIELFAVDDQNKLVAKLPNRGLSDAALTEFAERTGREFSHETNQGWAQMMDRYPPTMRSILQYQDLASR